MNLDEAIRHLDDILSKKEWKCEKCRENHIQLRDWLIELREIKDFMAGERRKNGNQEII